MTRSEITIAPAAIDSVYTEDFADQVIATLRFRRRCRSHSADEFYLGQAMLSRRGGMLALRPISEPKNMAEHEEIRIQPRQLHQSSFQSP